MDKAVYQFPENNPFRAREVLDLDFDIDAQGNADLYVPLDAVRIPDEDMDYRENLYFMLNIDPDSRALETLANDYSKVLVLGHRGCGKTTELRRMHKFLHHPERYFAVLVEIEKELEVSKMQPEDFYIIMLIRIIRELNGIGLHRAADCFDDLLKDWLSETEVQTEIVKSKGFAGGVGAKVDSDGNIFAKALSIFKFEAEIKRTLAEESTTTTRIRHRVKSDLTGFIVKFNNALAEVREHCAKAGQGRDLLFIVDGTEKTTFALYEEIFQKNGHILRSLNVNLVTTIRLDAFYILADKPNLDFFQQVFVPMVRLKDDDGGKSRATFADIVARRVDTERFFEPAALAHLVAFSGGSLRQLLRLANQCLLFSKGKKVDLARAQKTVEAEGDKLFHALNRTQKDMLEKGHWVDNWSHPDVSEMLYAMALLKYNGQADVNPLIAPYFRR